MPTISIMLLTKNRAELLEHALLSIAEQSFKDYEIILVDDGSNDFTGEIIEKYTAHKMPIKLIRHQVSIGITLSRQEALMKSQGKYVAILDDDDQWIDHEKLEKQVNFLESNPKIVLIGGGVEIFHFHFPVSRETLKIKPRIRKFRPKTNLQIRRTMLFKNNFFTSTVMFRKDSAIKAGGFIKDWDDFAEDYDLWLRMGKFGEMYNFHSVFTGYRLPHYNKAKFSAFLRKQLRLIESYKNYYPNYCLAKMYLKIRILM